VRSGYPVLLVGHYEGSGGHAICIVGFRDKVSTPCSAGSFAMADKDIEYVYVHDDNFGPNLRFKIDVGAHGEAVLVSSPPAYVGGGEPQPPRKFYPYTVIAAVHEDIRISADELFQKGVASSAAVVTLITNICRMTGAQAPSFTFSPRFILLRDYFNSELPKALSGATLAQVRLALMESIPPMSLHVGVIRIGTADNLLVMDLLYDTTDSGRSIPSFVSVIYDEQLYRFCDSLGIDFVAERLGLSQYIIPAF